MDYEEINLKILIINKLYKTLSDISPVRAKMSTATDKAFYSKENFESFANILKSANSQILFFSGNLTFSNQRHHDKTIRNIVEDLAARGVSSKILTRVEIPGINNIKNILAINRRVGKNMVEVRHCYHPLRLTIIDNKVAILKERLHPKNYEKGELPEKLHIFYYIYDQEWIEWMQKVFWKLFRASIDADKRIKDFSNMKIIR